MKNKILGLIYVPFKLFKKVINLIFKKIGLFKFIFETSQTQSPIYFSTWLLQKIIGFNRLAYWPVHFTSRVNNPQNIKVGIDCAPGIMPGCYIQGIGKIKIGDYTQIGPNVGIISGNHSSLDNRKMQLDQVILGKYCWVGMGAILLPGVKLGDFTTVAAGAIVTKSFTEGYVLIGGNPARIIKKIPKNKCIHYSNYYQYNGYIESSKFNKFNSKYLNKTV